MSTSSVTAPTLYADWQARRERLLRLGAAESTGVAQLAILEELLRRYQNSEAASQPARFPLPQEIVLKHRTVVVQSHAGSRGGPIGVRTEEESRGRVGSILQRLKTLDLQKSAGEPGDAVLVRRTSEPSSEAVMEPPPQQQPEPSRTLAVWNSVNDALRYAYSAWEVYRKIDHALSLHPVLPDRALEFLAARISRSFVDSCLAVEFLLRCMQEDALPHAVASWRNRLLNTGPDHVTARLRAVFERSDLRGAAADQMRLELVTENLNLRLEALSVLERVGTLDDIGFLLDLLSVPGVQGEDTRERQALLKAASHLAGVPLAPK